MKVFLGIGNKNKEDDAFGLKVVQKLKEEYGNRENLLFLECGLSPISFLGKIPSEPEELFFIDAVRLPGPEPGELIFRDMDEVKEKGLPISTHRLPLKMIKDKVDPGKAYLTGVKPLETGYGGEMSQEVKEAIPELVKKLSEYIES